MKTNNFGDLHFEIKFKDGSSWGDIFKRNLEIDKNLESKTTNKFVNDFMDGPDLMTMTSIKRVFKTWLKESNTLDQVDKINWYVA